MHLTIDFLNRAHLASRLEQVPLAELEDLTLIGPLWILTSMDGMPNLLYLRMDYYQTPLIEQEEQLDLSVFGALTKLREFYLWQTHVWEQDLTLVGDASWMGRLEKIDLRHCVFRPECAISFCEALASPDCKVQHLEFFGQQGLAFDFLQSNQSICTLHVEDSMTLEELQNAIPQDYEDPMDRVVEDFGSLVQGLAGNHSIRNLFVDLLNKTTVVPEEHWTVFFQYLSDCKLTKCSLSVDYPGHGRLVDKVLETFAHNTQALTVLEFPHRCDDATPDEWTERCLHQLVAQNRTLQRLVWFDQAENPWSQLIADLYRFDRNAVCASDSVDTWMEGLARIADSVDAINYVIRHHLHEMVQLGMI